MAVTLILIYFAAVAWQVSREPRGKRLLAVRRRLAALALIYVGTMLVLMFLENLLLYHPRKVLERYDLATPGAIENVTLPSEDGTMIHGWFYSTLAPQWHVLYAHGNGGNLSHRHGSCMEWQKLGAAVFIYDYPGYGNSEGKPSEAGCQAATRAAYAWLRDVRKVPPQEMIFFGESLGCAMAVELAATQPSRALVLYAPFTNIPDMAQDRFPWLPARWLVRTQYDNLAKIQHYQGPLFIAHGTEDSLVPFEQGRRLFEAAPSQYKTFFSVPGHGHNDGLIPEVFDAIDKFLQGIPAPDRSAAEKSQP